LHHGMTVFFFAFRHSDEASGQNLGLIGERVLGLGRLTEDVSQKRSPYSRLLFLRVQRLLDFKRSAVLDEPVSPQFHLWTCNLQHGTWNCSSQRPAGLSAFSEKCVTAVCSCPFEGWLFWFRPFLPICLGYRIDSEKENIKIDICLNSSHSEVFHPTSL